MGILTTQWKRTESGGYTAETPAGNDITIAKHGKVWSLILRGRGHVEREVYTTRGAAMATVAARAARAVALAEVVAEAAVVAEDLRPRP